MATKAQVSIIDAITKCTAADLAELDQRIAAKQQEREALTAKLDKELASLTSLRRVIDIAINGKKPRQSRKGKAAAAKSNGEPDGFRTAPARSPMAGAATLASRIVALLTREGPNTPEAIGRKLGETPGAVRQSVSRCSSQFKTLADGRIALPGFDESED